MSRCPGWRFAVLGGWLGYGISRRGWACGWSELWRLLPAAAAALGRVGALPVDGGGGGRGRRLVASAGRSTVLRWAFRLFDARIHRFDRALLRAVGRLLRVSVLVLMVYGGLLVLTYWGFGHDAQGVHPDAGHGLPDGQRATARRGLGRADAGRSMDRVRADLSLATPGREAHA